MANTNSINVTACVNELYILAVAGTTAGVPANSYQLCHILNSNATTPIDLTVTITALTTGTTYSQPQDQNVAKGLTNYTVSIPTTVDPDVYPNGAEYEIIAFGINWGNGQTGNAAFTVKSNSVTSPSFTSSASPSGTVPNIFLISTLVDGSAYTITV